MGHSRGAAEGGTFTLVSSDGGRGQELQMAVNHKTYMCGEPSSDPLQEQCMLLTAESSLQPLVTLFLTSKETNSGRLSCLPDR